MSEFWKTVLVGITAFIFGAGGLAIINIIQKRWEMKFDRKAKKEDKAEEKADEEKRQELERGDRLTEIVNKLDDFIDKQSEFNKLSAAQDKETQEQIEALTEGMKFVLLDRVLYLGQSYIKIGEVSFDDRKRLGDMHTVYHTKLKGNGDADAIMDGVYELPLKK